MQFRWDEFRLDVEGYALERSGAPVDLEPKAFDLLVLLVSRAGRLVPKQEIFDALWPSTAVSDHALTRIVAQLRRALGDEARESRYIETVPTRGYKWIRPLAEGPAPSTAVEPSPEPEEKAAPDARVGGLLPGRRSASIGLAVAGLVLLVVLTWARWPRATIPDSFAVRGPAALDVPGNVTAAFPVQITTRAGLELQPALAPDGHSIAFVSDRSGALEIHVRELSGGATETPLTSDGANNVQPAWSPDGRFIAFHSYRHGGIWVVPARGGFARQVADQGSNPSWSPDATRVAFQSDEFLDITPAGFPAQAGSTIWVANIDGSRRRQLTVAGNPIGGHGAPAWSPDGRDVAFTVFEGGQNNGLWAVDEASGAVRAFQRGVVLYEAVYAPDGSAIYATGGEAMVWRMPLDPATRAPTGREPIALAGLPGVRGLSISPDGRQLAVAGLTLLSHLWALPLGADLARAGEPRALTDDTSRRNSVPVISPDGARIAYMSRRRGQPPNVWVMNADGSSPMQATSDEATDGQPNWYPDSRRVGYLSNRDNRPGLWSVDLETRREQIVFALDEFKHPSPGSVPPRGVLAEMRVSPRFRQAAFSLLEPPSGLRAMFVTPLDRFEPRRLSDGTLSIGYPAWSPDEQQLAVEVKDGSSTYAAVVTVATGELRRLTRERGQSWVRSWSPDGRRVAFAACRDGQWSLRWIDVVSGQEGRLTEDAPINVYLRYPEWSPRGGLVVYERGDVSGNVFLVRTDGAMQPTP